jgi:RNA polymerase sigma factor (sigma-70 family)
MTDEQIMLEVSHGDLDMAKILYKRYSIPIYNFFLRICFNRDISQDLMQNVFFRIIKYRSSFNQEYKFRSWIYQIARNEYADYIKKDGAFRSNFVDLEKINLQVASRLNDMIKADRIRNLQRALTKISEDQREILIMKGYQKLKNKEIADILNCTENTVKGKVHRAIKSLREAFFKFENQ